MATKGLHQDKAPRHPPVEFDDDGFLLYPRRWSRSTARMMAELDGIGPLGPEHWAVVYYLREHYESYGSLPPMSQVCRTHGMEKHAVMALPVVDENGCLKGIVHLHDLMRSGVV